MGESLTERHRVVDDTLFGRKHLFRGTKLLTVPQEKAPANSVPAAAVRRKVQALLGITGRKASAGVLYRSGVKIQSSTLNLYRKPIGLSHTEAPGMPCVGVKSVDPW